MGVARDLVEELFVVFKSLYAPQSFESLVIKADIKETVALTSVLPNIRRVERGECGIEKKIGKQFTGTCNFLYSIK